MQRRKNFRTTNLTTRAQGEGDEREGDKSNKYDHYQQISRFLCGVYCVLCVVYLPMCIDAFYTAIARLFVFVAVSWRLLCLWVFGKPNGREKKKAKKRRVACYMVHTKRDARYSIQKSFVRRIRHSPFFGCFGCYFYAFLFRIVANQNKIPQPNATTAYSASLAISLLVYELRFFGHILFLRSVFQL